MHGAVTRAGEIGRPRHRSIRLLAEDAALLEALASRDSLRRRHGADASEPDLAHARELTRQSLDFMARVGATPPWLCYLTIGEDTGTLVGCCGFRGNPRDIGRGVMAPEIAYHTFPAFEGRGYATAMALRLVEVARGRCGVDRDRPPRCASTTRRRACSGAPASPSRARSTTLRTASSGAGGKSSCRRPWRPASDVCPSAQHQPA
jgi:RimJ/RimL family protein N-acetyltransferase